MNIKNISPHEIINRIKQFGFKTTLVQILKFLFRPIYRNESEIVLARLVHNNYTNNQVDKDINVGIINQKHIEYIKRMNLISTEHIELFEKFISQSDYGIIVDIDSKVAGYAFIQKDGIYTFSRSRGAINISNKVMVIKNLFVFPEYRGKSIGNQLVRVCIDKIPNSVVPISFVLSENIPSLRIFRRLNFDEILKITITEYLGYWKKVKYKIIVECDTADLVIRNICDIKY
jgi:N-acetylglutamate synthase-like GNAT family acetyltransferase